MRLLCGDIGGTKTELAIFTGEPGGWACERRKLYASLDFATFDALLADFRCETLDAAGLGAAGPVVDGRCKTTNLPWVLDATELRARLHAPVGVINDFHAMALGVRELGGDDLVVLQEGQRDVDGPVTVLGAGTGFGCAHLPHARAATVLSTEAGHADLAAPGPWAAGLLDFARRRHARPTVEHLLSGAGLSMVFDHVVDSGEVDASAELLDAVRTAADPAAVIGERSGRDRACERAVERFVELYGSEAANVALRLLPTGGMVIAGGIAAKVLAPFEAGVFVRAFTDKRPMSGLLARIPVSLALHPSTALLGARVAACMLYSNTAAPSRD